MPWRYGEIPASIRLPACPNCSNRGRVAQVARQVYVCTDCNPPHPFVAVWQDERTAGVSVREARSEDAVSEIWEPWRPEIGQRVKIRLSAECQARAFNASPPPGVSDDDLREMMRARVDVAKRYAHDDWREGHPEWLDGVEGTVTDVNRAIDYGHHYRVMFDEAVGPDSYVGIDLAAIELEPVD